MPYLVSQYGLNSLEPDWKLRHTGEGKGQQGHVDSTPRKMGANRWRVSRNEAEQQAEDMQWGKRDPVEELH